jgi:hypothetical protein
LAKSRSIEKTGTQGRWPWCWLLAPEASIVPITGTTKLHHSEENIGAVDIELSPDDLREIDATASMINDHVVWCSVPRTVGANDRSLRHGTCKLFERRALTEQRHSVLVARRKKSE